MKLPAALLKTFAEQVTVKDKKNSPATCYGTVMSKNDNQAIVHLDGSTIDTPVDCAMDVEPSDRVMVQIFNHKALVIGNTTSPASARTANAYMKLVDDGLVIGKINDSNSPAYLFLSGDAYYIKKQTVNSETGESCSINPTEDETIASFKDEQIFLGGLNSTIDFCKSKVQIRTYTDNDNSYVVIADDNNAIRLGEFKHFTTVHKGVSIVSEYPVSFILKDERPNVMPIDNNPYVKRKYFDNKIVTQPIKDPILTVGTLGSNLNLYKTGSIQVSDTIAANSYKTMTSAVIDVPFGYVLLGIMSITTNHASVCHMTQFWTSMTDNKVSATFHNDGNSNQDLTVTFKYFCIRSS